MKRLLIGFVALLAIGSSACVIDSTEDSSLTVYNDSSYELYELYVAEETAPTWGYNLISDTGLFPGESIDILLDCGTYDVLVVDDIGAECELVGLSLCFDDATWVIDDFELALCSF